MDNVEEEVESLKEILLKMDQKVFAVEKVVARIEKIKHDKQR